MYDMEWGGFGFRNARSGCRYLLGYYQNAIRYV